MVEALIKHNVKWLAPSPLWTQDGIKTTGPPNGSFNRPAILRFQNDLFMEELLALTAYQPDRLNEWVAQPETWREPMPTPPTAAQLRVVDPISKRSQRIAKETTHLIKNNIGANTNVSSNSKETNSNSEQLPFKLYQPAHQRYYMAAAALVCRKPGLPDRAVDPGRQERVGFVIRRIIHTNQDDSDACDPDNPSCQEYAFVNTPNGNAWKAIKHNERKHIQKEEERLPLFAINFDETGYRRRLFAGLIPVGKREAYLAAPKHKSADPNSEESNGTQTSPDPRRILFEADVIAPWKALVEQAAYTNESLSQTFSIPGVDPDGKDDEAKKDVRKSAREQIQTVSWYILLDFANYLEQYLPEIWEAVKNSAKKGNLGISTPKRILYDTLETVTVTFTANLIGDDTGYVTPDVKTNLIDALVAIKAEVLKEKNLETISEPYDRGSKNGAIAIGWPPFLFPFADPEITCSTDGPVPDVVTEIDDWAEATNLDITLARIDVLADLIEAALDEPLSPLPEIERIQEPWDKRDAWFVIRCVYERPNCGPINPEVVSDPTQPFQMAPFFDPDAPARPIRIPMPIDISPAGLRKFKNNTTFMISDMLCGKIKRIRKLTLGDLVLSVLPWPFHKNLPSVGPTGPCSGKDGNFGMFCSLSIPIVTLCALILLLIIVPLFNVFFRWLPYLFTCLPIPGLKGKKND